MPFSSNIDQEYENDPRRRFLEVAQAQTLNQPAPLSPIAGGLQGVNILLQALLQNKIAGQHLERKAAYKKAVAGAISSLRPDATAADLSRAYAESGNPDLASDAADMMAQAVMSRKAPTFATMKGYDAQDRPFVTSSSGEVQYLPIERERERQVPVNLGDRYVMRGERTGAVSPAEGLEVGVSPTARFSAGAQDARSAAGRAASAQESAASRAFRAEQGAANRAARVQSAELQSKGLLGLAGGMNRQDTYDEAINKQLPRIEAQDFSKNVYPAAKSAKKALGYVDMARGNLEKAFTGPGAQEKFALMSGVSAAATSLLGAPTFDRVAATNVLDQSLSSLGVLGMKDLVGESRNLSDADLKAAMTAVGQIQNDPRAINTVLDSLESGFVERIEESNNFVDARVRGGVTDFEKRRIEVPERRQETAPAGDAPLTPEEKAELEALRRAQGAAQ